MRSRLCFSRVLRLNALMENSMIVHIKWKVEGWFFKMWKHRAMQPCKRNEWLNSNIFLMQISMVLWEKQVVGTFNGRRHYLVVVYCMNWEDKIQGYMATTRKGKERWRYWRVFLVICSRESLHMERNRSWLFKEIFKQQICKEITTFGKES